MIIILFPLDNYPVLFRLIYLSSGALVEPPQLLSVSRSREVHSRTVRISFEDFAVGFSFRAAIYSNASDLLGPCHASWGMARPPPSQPRRAPGPPTPACTVQLSFQASCSAKFISDFWESGEFHLSLTVVRISFEKSQHENFIRDCSPWEFHSRLLAMRISFWLARQCERSWEVHSSPKSVGFSFEDSSVGFSFENSYMGFSFENAQKSPHIGRTGKVCLAPQSAAARLFPSCQ